MANRVTVAEVKGILDDTELTDIVIGHFITGANSIITAALASAGLGAALMKEIERYTAAHLISITRDRMAAKEGAGGASITYTGTYGQGFNSSSYGQTAIAFDTSGILAGFGGRAASTYAIPSTD